MIAIVFPVGLNWFYERLASVLEQELNERGLPAIAVPAHTLHEMSVHADDCALVVSAAESASSTERLGARKAFIGAIRRFNRRVLVNYDSLHTHWFVRQLKLGDGLFTDVLDIGAAPQAVRSYGGLAYHWIPEPLWLSDGANGDRAWSADRPVPWAVIGHMTQDRAALVSALLRLGQPDGFVYLPPLKPYGVGRGLDEAALKAVMQASEVYVWNSHHAHPYHEGLRAVQAVLAGAVPAKIDPLHARAFPDLPWVYPSVRAMLAARDRLGPRELHGRAYRYLASLTPLGESIATTLSG